MIKEFKVSHQALERPPIIDGIPEKLRNKISAEDYRGLKMMEYCMEQLFCENVTYSLLHITDDGKMKYDTFPYYDMIRMFLYDDSNIIKEYAIKLINYIDDCELADMEKAQEIYMEWRYGSDWRNKQDEWDIKEQDVERLLKMLNRKDIYDDEVLCCYGFRKSRRCKRGYFSRAQHKSNSDIFQKPVKNFYDSRSYQSKLTGR